MKIKKYSLVHSFIGLIFQNFGKIQITGHNLSRYVEEGVTVCNQKIFTGLPNSQNNEVEVVKCQNGMSCTLAITSCILSLDITI